MNRNDHIVQLENEKEWDLLIVGGGATGLGVAVDAASRGYRVALIEQADFSKGTSSRSTKLVHGGVRYLKQGNIKLVREALHERDRLARNAPHLVADMKFVIPSYTRFNRFFYGVGMKVYDFLAGKLRLGNSERLSREQTLEYLPTVKPESLKGGVLYHDGQFDDSRLAITLARTAAAEGAVLVNYCKCIGFSGKPGERIQGVRVLDVEGKREFEVRAKAVVNASGVFVDELRKHSDPGVKEIVSVSQGIHLILPKRFLPGSAALMIPKTSDGRVLFAVPWHDCLILGTTDTPLKEASLEPRALEEEYRFLMTHAKKYFLEAPKDSDVLSIFAGLRPLVKSGHEEKTSSLSRDHTVIIDKRGLLTVTGGKWTTYRKMAEDVVNQVQKLADLPPVECRTQNKRLHGALDDSLLKDYPWGDPLRVYGSDISNIQAIIKQQPELAERIHPELPYCLAEVVWHVRNEMARSIEDVLARRTRSLLLDARASLEAAPRVAELMAGELGYGTSWCEAQCKEYEQLVAGYLPPIR